MLFRGEDEMHLNPAVALLVVYIARKILLWYCLLLFQFNKLNASADQNEWEMFYSNLMAFVNE